MSAKSHVVLFLIAFSFLLFGCISNQGSEIGKKSQYDISNIVQNGIEEVVFRSPSQNNSSIPPSISVPQPEKKISGNEGLKILSDGVYSYIISDDDGDIWTVCERPCAIPRSTLIAKHKGMATAVNKLKKFLAVDFADGVKPLKVHLAGDSTCGDATNDSTGFYLISSGSDYGKAHICTFDYGKANRILPFNEENAIRIQDQLLFVHEAVHVMFYKRTIVSYNIQEPFAKAISFHISGNWDGDGTSDSDFKPVSTACDQSIFSFAKAPFLLCKYYGFDFKDYGSLFILADEKYSKTQKAVTDSQFKNYITDVVGKDTSDAWKASQE